MTVSSFAWTMRVIAVVLLISVILANLVSGINLRVAKQWTGFQTMSQRPLASNLKSSGKFIDVSCLRSMAFATFCLSAFFTFLGIYTRTSDCMSSSQAEVHTALTYVDISAISIGFSEDVSFYFVAVVNASSGLGRCFAGSLADFIGK